MMATFMISLKFKITINEMNLKKIAQIEFDYKLNV